MPRYIASKKYKDDDEFGIIDTELSGKDSGAIVWIAEFYDETLRDIALEALNSTKVLSRTTQEERDDVLRNLVAYWQCPSCKQTHDSDVKRCGFCGYSNVIRPAKGD